ncbi:MAG TPA: AraC family transcriptional regulator [Myxococcales bacterium]|nr:AraC family transcriptional regulator [Myxococcales bacterium]
MDVLTHVLQSLRVEGTIFARAEVRGSWGVRVAPSDSLMFHICDSGGGVLAVKGEEPITFSAGELVMVSCASEHVIADSLETVPLSFDEFRERGMETYQSKHGGQVCGEHCSLLELDGEGPPTTLYCGSFLFEGGNEHPLLSVIPPLVHIKHEDHKTAPWLETIIRYMSYESSEQLQGVDTAISRLADLLFLQIIRTWLARQPEGEGGWLGALSDKHIGHAIQLIHDKPEHPWTVESLGRTVGMSRSGFSARFLALVGEAPLKYVTQWRMRTAASMLQKQQGLSLDQVARSVGYDSVVSFSRAFKRYFHLSPGAWRKKSGPV